MATVTNQLASQSLRGQDVIVTLSGAEVASKLPAITVGQVCTNGSSSFTGKVSSVDSFGSTFKIRPTMPSGNFSSSSTPGFLAAAETITIT